MIDRRARPTGVGNAFVPSRMRSQRMLPAGVSFRRQDRLDNRHACYAGHVGIGLDAKLKQRIKDTDLLIVIGTRLGDVGL